VVRKNRLTNTAKLIIVVGIIAVSLGAIFSIPNLGINAQPDIGIIKDQLAVSDDFVPFRFTRATTTTTIGQTTTVDPSNTIDAITSSQVSSFLRELPSSCGLKLQTTIVYDDNSRQVFSTGATSFAPVQTLSLVTGQGQVIKQFETVPLLRCPEVFGLDGTRYGYEHEWLQGVNINWDAYKEDGTLFIEGTGTGVNTVSKEAISFGGLFAIPSQLINPPPECNPVTFADIGDVKATGLYSDSQIARWQETFGSADGGIFIGSERAICAKDVNGVVADPFIVTADELEQRIGSAGKSFETTLIIVPTFGTSILEIPFLSQQLGETFVSVNGIDQFVTKQFLSFTVDNLSEQIDPEDVTPPPLGITRTIKTISFDPVKIDIANLEEVDRTVTWRIALNSYDTSEGTPVIVVGSDRSGEGALLQTLFPTGITASFPMKDAGISGDSRLFEGEWIVQSGQTLGSYELKVSMVSRTNDVVKIVEVVQKAQDAPKETPVNGQCKAGQQLVEDKDGVNICVAECAGDLIWDKFTGACAVEAGCTGDLEIIVAEDGSKTCGKDPIPEVPDDQKCDPELTFNSVTNKCEIPTKDPPLVCKMGEQLVNTGGGRTSCLPALPDFIKLLTPIPCSDKIGFTDAGFCLPPTIVGFFQNPIQLVFIGIGLIVVILVLKFLFRSVNRQRGGIVLN